MFSLTLAAPGRGYSEQDLQSERIGSECGSQIRTASGWRGRQRGHDARAQRVGLNLVVFDLGTKTSGPRNGPLTRDRTN